MNRWCRPGTVAGHSPLRRNYCTVVASWQFDPSVPTETTHTLRMPLPAVNPSRVSELRPLFTDDLNNHRNK
jgi:hypothetical protein